MKQYRLFGNRSFLTVALALFLFSLSPFAGTKTWAEPKQGESKQTESKQTVSKQADPAYAKWGRIAVLETQKRYPGTEIIDYLHLGKQQLSPTLSQESFRLLLRKENRIWPVIVRILFETASENILQIKMEEADG